MATFWQDMVPHMQRGDKWQYDFKVAPDVYFAGSRGMRLSTAAFVVCWWLEIEASKMLFFALNV